MKRSLVLGLLASLLLVAACTSQKLEVLKTPCAGIDGSPCGPKRPLNGTLNPQLHQPAAGEQV